MSQFVTFNSYNRPKNKKSQTHTTRPPNSELHHERALDLRLSVTPEPGELPLSLGPTPVGFDESSPWNSSDPNQNKMFDTNGKLESLDYL